MMDREDYRPRRSFVSEAERIAMRRDWFFLRRFGPQYIVVALYREMLN